MTIAVIQILAEDVQTSLMQMEMGEERCVTIRITTVVEDAVNHSMTRFVTLVFILKYSIRSEQQ